MSLETPPQAKQLTGGAAVSNRCSTRPVLLRIVEPSTLAELHEECKRAVAAGFDGVELPLDAGGWDVRAKRGRAQQAPSVPPEACETPPSDAWGTPAGGDIGFKPVEHDLKISALAARCVATDVEGATAEVAALLNRAASLGAQCLNLTIPPIAKLEHGGAPAEGDISLGHATQSVPLREGFASYQEAINFVHHFLQRIRMGAEDCGVAVALEGGSGGCLLSPVEFREIIDTANSWAVGACVDAARVARFSSPADWIRTLAGRLHAVRVGHRFQTGATETADLSPSTRAINDALDETRYDRSVIAVPESVS